jgi:RNA polymerase sigma-70 factor (ECF subfamily)
VRRYAPVLYSLAYRLLGAREEAEEAVQEIFLRAFRALPRFRLPTRYRAVFVLRQIEGLEVRDVAEILGLPEGTVKSFLHRGRALLITRLGDEGVVGPSA